jgi:hypothetical protein
MKITRKKLRMIVEQFLFEKKVKYVDDDKWEANKARIKDSHLYGDPEKRKVLKKALLAKWPGKKINKLLCETCHAYDTSEKAKEAGVKEGNGYCIAFDFSCSGKNSCTGWLPK